jgi:ribosomal protein S18 acetylase RimI-like enzyme
MSRFAPYQPRECLNPSAPADVTYRPPTRQDAPAVATMMAEREGATPETFLAKLQAEFARHDEDAKRFLLVAERQGEVVGFGRAVYSVPAADAPPNHAPSGWYLGGVVVTPSHRRRGIGHELTRRRLDWLIERGASEAWFVVNADNRASIDLHAALGVREVTRDFVQAGVTFSGRGEGILFRIELPSRQTR